MEVYFDDFKVTQTKSPVVASDDYYPGGALFNSYTRENSVINKRKYQGKEWQTELGLELYDFGRPYDPWILHTITQDAHAENYYSWSPYSWAFDNPVRYGDPTGKDPIDKALGFLSAVLDNALGGVSPLREMAASHINDANDFNTGLTGGDLFSLFAGVIESEAGAGVTGASLVLAAPSAGTTLTTAAAGTALVAHGVVLSTAGVNNLINQKGRVNTEGKSKEKKSSDGKERQKSETKLEKALNQSEGIGKAQEVAKKQAPPGQKQTKITNTKKSDQRAATELKRIKSLDDLQH